MTLFLGEIMKINRKQKAVATAGFLTVSAMAVFGGTLAQFTDRDTTAPQTLTAGTVDVTLTEGANWDTANLLLAVDDTVTRNVTVSNDGNLNIKAIQLSADVADTPGLDPTANLSDAVQVTVSQGTDVLAPAVLLSDLSDYTLVLPSGLAPADSVELTFAYKVVATEAPAVLDDPATTTVDESAPAGFVDGDFTKGARSDFATNPDNRFQDAAVTVDYTVDAIQRDAVNQ